jgi:hypothetical protein
MTKQQLLNLRRNLIGALKEVEKALLDITIAENNKNVKVIDKA